MKFASNKLLPNKMLSIPIHAFTAFLTRFNIETRMNQLSLALFDQIDSLKKLSVVNLFYLEAEKGKAISKFKKLTDLVSDGGTIILGGCWIMTTWDDIKDYDPGANLLVQLSNLTGNRLNFMANADATVELIDGDFLDVGRTHTRDFKYGWSELSTSSDDETNSSSSDEQVNRTNKNLQLNSSGDMYQSIDDPSTQ